MSADNPEQGDGGSDLRARYLPVSRKELRRRREAELAAMKGDAPAPVPSPVASDAAAEDSAAEDSAETTDVTLQPVPEEELDDLHDDADDAGGAELAEQPGHDDPDDASVQEDSTDDEGDVAEETARSVDEAEEDDALPGEGGSSEPSADTDEEPPASEAVTPDEAEAAEQPAPALGEDDPDAPDDEDEGASDEETAPVPASRKGRRLLRETGSMEALTDERLEEIDELTAQISAQPVQDPHRVDPDVLKKQQALAAKAMQANQERRRRELVDAERDRIRRGRERPESEVITRKALRAYVTPDDQEQVEVAAGDIDPIDAQGAHGLELDDMVEHSSRQASRQAGLLWLVIVLAALLLIAVGVVLFTLL